MTDAKTKILYSLYSVAFVRSTFLVLYMEAWMIFHPILLTSMFMLFLGNMGNMREKLEKFSVFTYLTDTLSLVPLIYSYSLEPEYRITELLRITSIVLIQRKVAASTNTIEFDTFFSHLDSYLGKFSSYFKFEKKQAQS